jgi:hypothetical protein
MREHEKESRTGVLQVLSAVAVALLCFGCETPTLKGDSLYPADWPPLAGPGEKCLAIGGTYANLGRAVDAKGKPADAWLTDVLAAMPTPREGEALRALHACARVTLHVESFPSQIRSDVLMQRIVAVPQRRIGESPEQWTDCADIHLPRGPGYPHSPAGTPTYESGIGFCFPTVFAYVNPRPMGIGITAALTLYFAVARDGSLIVKVGSGPEHTTETWARFGKVR